MNDQFNQFRNRLSPQPPPNPPPKPTQERVWLHRIEAYAVIASTFFAAAAAGISAWGAWSTDTQADYARAALTAADLNRTFEAYIRSFDGYCQSLNDSLQEFVIVASPNQRETELVIMWFVRQDLTAVKPVKVTKDEISDKYQSTRRDLDLLRLWLSPIEANNLAAMDWNIFNYDSVFTRDHYPNYSQDEAIKLAGYCRYLYDNQVDWFSEGRGPLQYYQYSQVTVQQGPN